MITQRDESMMMIRFVYIIAYLAELLCKTDRRRSRFNMAINIKYNRKNP